MEKHIIIPPPDTEALIGIIAHQLGLELDNILELGAEVSQNISQTSGTDIPDGTTIKSVTNVPSPIIDKIVASDQKHTPSGAVHD